MYACPGLYMPRVGSRQASLNKLIWCTLLCYLLCSGDKICSFHWMTIIKASLEEAGAGSYLLVIKMTVENIEG